MLEYLIKSFDVVTCPSADTDPFLEADTEVELQSLIERALPEGERCNVREYVEGDDDLPVCTDLDSENWEENFLSELGEEQIGQEEDDEEDDEECDTQDQAPLKITTYNEAIDSLENVVHYLQSQGHTEECFSPGNFVDRVTALKLSRLKQTTICDFFTA